MAPLIVAVTLMGGAVAQSTPLHALTPPHHPSANYPVTSLARVLASINAARHVEEGLAPIRFDRRRFDRLSVPRQIFVLSNLERTTRGLPALVALVPALDRVAQSAARHDADPQNPGRTYWSLWSSAPAAWGNYALVADFGWMYADGPPPFHIFRNVDCLRAGERGCWGHRDNLLARAPAARCRQQMVAGAGFAAHSPDGPSLTLIIEPQCRGRTLRAAFTWRQALAGLVIEGRTSRG
jgi:hypothetical protein